MYHCETRCLQRGPPRVPVGRLLVGVGDAEHRRLVEGAGDDLEADGSCLPSASTKPRGDGDAGEAGDVHGQREDVVQVHLQTGSSTFSPSLKAGVGVTGVRIASKRSKAASNSRRIRVRTFCALR